MAVRSHALSRQISSIYIYISDQKPRQTPPSLLLCFKLPSLFVATRGRHRYSQSSARGQSETRSHAERGHARRSRLPPRREDVLRRAEEARPKEEEEKHGAEVLEFPRRSGLQAALLPGDHVRPHVDPRVPPDPHEVRGPARGRRAPRSVLRGSSGRARPRAGAGHRRSSGESAGRVSVLFSWRGCLILTPNVFPYDNIWN